MHQLQTSNTLFFITMKWNTIFILLSAPFTTFACFPAEKQQKFQRSRAHMPNVRKLLRPYLDTLETYAERAEFVALLGDNENLHRRRTEAIGDLLGGFGLDSESLDMLYDIFSFLFGEDGSDSCLVDFGTFLTENEAITTSALTVWGFALFDSFSNTCEDLAFLGDLVPDDLISFRNLEQTGDDSIECLVDFGSGFVTPFLENAFQDSCENAGGDFVSTNIVTRCALNDEDYEQLSSFDIEFRDSPWCFPVSCNMEEEVFPYINTFLDIIEVTLEYIGIAYECEFSVGDGEGMTIELDSCMSETATIVTNEAVLDTGLDLYAKAGELLYYSYDVDAFENGTYQYSTFSLEDGELAPYYEAFEDACLAVDNSKFVSIYELVSECDQYNITGTFLNLPVCVGISCADETDEFLNNLLGLLDSSSGFLFPSDDDEEGAEVMIDNEEFDDEEIEVYEPLEFYFGIVFGECSTNLRISESDVFTPVPSSLATSPPVANPDLSTPSSSILDSSMPTSGHSLAPTSMPTLKPSLAPTDMPTLKPSSAPIDIATSTVSLVPTDNTENISTNSPSTQTSSPSLGPSASSFLSSILAFAVFAGMYWL